MRDETEITTTFRDADTPDTSLRSFAREFLHTLRASYREIEPDLWQVDLDADQRALLDPWPVLPFWALSPTPPETVRWWIAFTVEAAERHPEAKLLTYNSQLFHQLVDTCRRQGSVFTGTLFDPRADTYTPWLWLHLRRTRRGEPSDTSIEPWAFHLVSGRIERIPPPDSAAVRPGMPPVGPYVETPRLTPAEVWRSLSSRILAEEESRDGAWTEIPLSKMREEEQEVMAYYESQLASDDSAHDDSKAEAAVLEERRRRLEEVRGRHFPRVIVEPVAATLIYVPVP